MTSSGSASNKDTTIGFIGLGIMGGPMATNLASAGFDVVGFNRTRQKADALASKGIRPVGTLEEAVRDADVVITVLPDSPDVESVVFGESGVFAHTKENLLYIDMSTIRRDVAVQIAQVGKSQNIRVLDAPVSGGETGAIEGSLSIMVGGEASAFEAAAPIFAALGTTIVHVGPSGSGQTVKAANQLIVAGNLAILSEALVFLEATGVDTAASVKVLGGGLAGSTVLNRKAENMLKRSLAPGFRLDLMHKDMGIVQSAAREAGVITLVGAVATELIASLVAQGYGDLDHSAIIKVVEQLSKRD